MMPKSKMMKVRRKTTLMRFGREISKIFTNFFIEGMAYMLLRGRRALKALRPLSEVDMNGMNSKKHVTTTKKSSTFQPSRR